ncbi:hypothetical protein M758_9G122000 [Ceratodon purpureus]|nr:hypothetical protein M758_9G122000 [Ceratodon purpureus]
MVRWRGESIEEEGGERGGMYPLRLFAKPPSLKKLAYEDYDGEGSSVGDEDGVQSAADLAVTPRFAFVTTRGENGDGGNLWSPKLDHGIVGAHVNEFALSPPKAIEARRKRNPRSDLGGHGDVLESAKNGQSAPSTPVRAPKRRMTKLTWQSRASPDKHKSSQLGRSPSLTRGQFDKSCFDAASDVGSVKSLQQPASSSGMGTRDSVLNNFKSGPGHSQKGGVDSMPSTPLGSRKPRNSELNSSITSLGSVTSAATPRSAKRHGGHSSTSNALAAAGLMSTRANGVRALLQNQQADQAATEPAQFQLEEDPTFWQDHSVQVLIRTRPISNSEASQQGHSRCVKQESPHTITWIGQPEARFTFDHVAGESISQEELFRVAGLPMVENCMSGYNSCMFAYGQTGSGKTHTMLGDISDLHNQPSNNRGMTPRVFESLFTKIKMAEELQKQENLRFKCRCSFLEIYNEQIVDLLEPSSFNLQMREDANKGVYVEGLLEVEVQNVQDVIHLLLLGAANRKVAATNMNKESSRSHSVFTCTIESQWESDHMINYRFGRLNLVDLAGSERQRASGADGERLKEAASINKSLSTLGLVIMVLVDAANGKPRHVPYRDSKLTFLLQDSLGGNSKTTIIANISPSNCASLETLSTLKFAQRAKFIQNNAVINEDTAGDLNALRQQIQQLKDELARLRRQSISLIPTVRASGVGVLREEAIDEGSPSCSNEGLNNSIEGSFLQFGRTVQSPTVLNEKIMSLEAVLAGALRRELVAELSAKKSVAEIGHLTCLVKQREEETQCIKMILRFREEKIRRLETLSDGGLTKDTFLVEEKDAALKELQLMRDEKGCKLEDTRFAMENMRLQEQLRKLQDFHTSGEREAMIKEISDLRYQLGDVLDSKLSLDTLAHSQKDASAVELVAERRQQELLHTQVESYRRELEECRTNFSACLTSNDDMGRQLDELRNELKVANEACSKYKIECTNLNTQLQVLEPELQWTKDSLKTAEAALEKLQQNQLSPYMGVNQGLHLELNQSHVINQLQLELCETKATLEDERLRGRGLEEQLADHGKQERRRLKRVDSTGSHDSLGQTRVRHHDAILQLQMELDSIDGAPQSAIRSYRWEEGTRDEEAMDEAEVKHSVTIMQLQLDLESVEGTLKAERKRRKGVEASYALLQKQLEETSSQLLSEKKAVVLELDSLRIDHQALLEKLRKMEEMKSELKQRITQLESEFSNEQELCTKEITGQSKYSQVVDSKRSVFNLKLEKATGELEESKSLRIRGEQSSRVAFEQQVVTAHSKVELKASLGSTSIQLELSELRDEVAGAMEREAAAREHVTRLTDLLKHKEAEICTLQQDWEGAAAKLVDYLAAGKLSVDAVCSKSTQELFNTSLSRGKKTTTDRIVSKVLETQTAVMSLTKQLQDARNRADSFRRIFQDSLSKFICHDNFVYCSNDITGKVRESMLRAHQDAMTLKVEVESCDELLREVESKSAIAFITVWWLSETAGLRCVAEDRMRIELTEAVAKIHERQGVLFSLQLEREKTPEKESRTIHFEALRVEKELAAWEEERIRLVAINQRFETQVRQIAKMLEHLHLQFQTVEGRLQLATEKSTELASAQNSLLIVKEEWNLGKSALVIAATEADQQCTRLKEELSATKIELQKLENRTLRAEAREDELQNERAKLEKELNQHLEAVQVLADDLQNQIELKEQENSRLKEQMAEQDENWVLERSDLLVATREAESSCIEKNRTITSLQRNLAYLQGQVSGACYKPGLQNVKMYKLVEDEVESQLEDRIEELNEAVDRLTAENLELRNEKLFLSDHTGKKLHMVAQKEVKSSALQERLLDAEGHQTQAESKVVALTLLVEELTCSEKSWQAEKEFLKEEVKSLQSSLETLVLEIQSYQAERDSCLKRLAEMDENKEFLKSSAYRSPMTGSKNVHAELRSAHTAPASLEEQVKLLTEMVSIMGEDWAAERQNLISEKEDLRMELSQWEQNSDIRRSSDVCLRNLSENRSVPAPDASSNTKSGDRLRQDLEKIRTENVKLRSRTREQDQAYLSVRMELSAAHAKHKDLEIEMVTEKQHLRKQLEATLLEVDRQQAHIHSCESELQRLTMLLVEGEEQMNTAEQIWKTEKAQLEAEREEARVEAKENRKEASDMLVKFEEWKITLREADSMVNALVRVNEKAKERWKREKERLASSQNEETNKVVLEMLEAVALTKEQVDMTMGHAESEMRALVTEAQIMRLDMTHEILKLKREISGNNHETSGSFEQVASARCMDSERRSWEHQIKAASVVLSQKEATILSLQLEVEKTRKQTLGVQTLHAGTQAMLQEKENMILKLVNELNHLNQSMNRDRTLRQSLTRDVENVTSLRRSFSCKTVENRDSTLSVLKEEQEQLKTMVFNLEVENAELQEQLVDAEMKIKALESTIEHFRKSDDRWVEEVRSLEEQLEENARHISELENHRMELRDEMQRQAGSFAELYEQLRKQEGSLEGEARGISNKVAAEKEILHTLQEEKAELKKIVERLDAELSVYEKNAESSQTEVERLQLEMECLRKEFLQKEINLQNVNLDNMSLERSKLEADIAVKNKELTVLGEELESKKTLADLAAHESQELKGQVDDLLSKASALEEEVTRKMTAINALKTELLAVEENMARCLEDASVDLKELEIERDNLQNELRTLSEQLQEAQALADEQTAIASEARQYAELSRARAEEKQIEAEILGRSVVELESTVYALESQLGIVERESERQRLMREDMEMELEGLKNHLSVMQAALEEASARSADNILEAQLAREETESKLKEKEAEMRLAQKKLEILQKDSEIKAEKIRQSKVQIAEILSEAENMAAEYEEKLRAVETKLEGVNSQHTVPRGPKVRGTGSSFACIGMGHQANSELNVELQMYEHRIQELEVDLSNQQKEVCILNGKLAAAERMTYEVLRDLLGVKADITSVASLLGEQEEQDTLQAQKGPLEKDEEVEYLL